ncbi:MAG: acyl-CoA dehydrogenase, partial [Candidatus Wallbacteria bacterium]|nr:acyl-CoA dehydrogenase [Candidatus Wallbacteria bacterium]
TVHVNIALIMKFVANYFFKPADFPPVPRVLEPRNDDFLFDQGPTKGLGKIQFHDYNRIYAAFTLPNVDIFKEQIAAFKDFLIKASPDAGQQNDIDFLFSVGEIFTLVVYGQLILENAALMKVEDDVVDQIFDFMVRDFSRFSLQLYSKPSSSARQMECCMKMVRKPNVDEGRYQRVLKDHVYALKGAYEMSDNPA